MQSLMQCASQGGEDGDADEKRLEMPYLRVPKALPVAVLAKYVAQRLSQARARVQLFYKDRELQQGQTVRMSVLPAPGTQP